MQPGDVPATAADTSALESWVGFKPSTSIDEGIDKFVSWYKNIINLIANFIFYFCYCFMDCTFPLDNFTLPLLAWVM